MTEENIQVHLNDCSQHSSKFICHECGMVSENFLCFPSLSSKRDHEEMKQEHDKVMEGTDKKIKT